MVKSFDENSFSIMAGPNRAFEAIKNTRGVYLQDIIPPIIRRVDELTASGNGRGDVRSKKMVLDMETRKELGALDARLRKAMSLFTHNPVINVGACVLWDRMGQKIDKDSIEIAMEYLEIKQ